MAALRIRLARLDDMPALAGIFRRSSLSNEGDRTALLAHPDVLEFGDRAVREGRTRVAAFDDGPVIGFITTRIVDAVLDLEDLFVDPQWMRHGAGRALVADAVSLASSSGFERVVVTANPHARAFYEAVGFEADGSEATPFGTGLRMRLPVRR